MTQHRYDAGILPGSAYQCILGNVYLKFDLPSIYIDLNSASDSQTASSLRTLLQRFCNTLSPTCMAMHYMPNSYAKHPVFTLMLRALIQTIYRALLTSAVSGIGHRIHTLQKSICIVLYKEEDECPFKTRNS